ncbi:Dyp-type peroxidase domain-containing protein, partial [Acinetobacter baumannii]
QTLLATWSAASAQLMRGATIGQVEPSQPSAIGDDTGEAVDLDPASLTVTIGLGPRVFGDEYGLAAQKPPLLRELSRLPSEALDPSLTGG